MKKAYAVVLILLSVLTLLSLALNGVVIFGLSKARQIGLDAQQAASDTVADTRSLIKGIENDTFSYTLEVAQEIPISARVPFREEVSVPIRTTIPISTTVVIPIRAGILGTFDLDVPVYAMVPVSLDVTVPISHTVDIETTVPLNVDVPIEIPLSDTPLVGYLDELDSGLESLEISLGGLGKQLRNPLNLKE
ncbi:MAG TPA: hypothetical protein ENN19_01000 [Chloroflexi bacterium]|nr:hypothetical protein [Chloroflexota bacterium]